MPENVKILNPPKDILKAVKLIDKFLIKNKIEIEYTVDIDLTLKDCYGSYNNIKHPHTIKINPLIFKEEERCLGYPEDYSMFSVVIHEFSHFLDFHHSNLRKDYRKEFPEKILINNNSFLDDLEEFAEVLSLYLINPFLLKSIEPDAYNYFKDRFISPVPTTKVQFMKYWEKWSVGIQTECLEKWKIP